MHACVCVLVVLGVGFVGVLGSFCLVLLVVVCRVFLIFLFLKGVLKACICFLLQALVLFSQYWFHIFYMFNIRFNWFNMLLHVIYMLFDYIMFSLIRICYFYVISMFWSVCVCGGEEGWWEERVLCFDRFVLFSLGSLSLFVGFVFTDSALFLNIFECFWNVLYVFRCYLYVLIALYCFLYLLDLFT